MAKWFDPGVSAAQWLVKNVGQRVVDEAIAKVWPPGVTAHFANMRIGVPGEPRLFRGAAAPAAPRAEAPYGPSRNVGHLHGIVDALRRC